MEPSDAGEAVPAGAHAEEQVVAHLVFDGAVSVPRVAQGAQRGGQVVGNGVGSGRGRHSVESMHHRRFRQRLGARARDRRLRGPEPGEAPEKPGKTAKYRGRQAGLTPWDWEYGPNEGVGSDERGGT